MPRNRTMPIEERFWSKVDQSGECWTWTAFCDPNGYGRFAVKKIPRLAHRIAWELTYGPIADGQFVCHHCDNPGCVNPAHLFLGTNADNIRDMEIKGRRGAKLTVVEVRAIRAEWKPGVTYLALARKYGVSNVTISNIVNRRQWRFID